MQQRHSWALSDFYVMGASRLSNVDSGEIDGLKWRIIEVSRVLLDSFKYPSLQLLMSIADSSLLGWSASRLTLMTIAEASRYQNKSFYSVIIPLLTVVTITPAMLLVTFPHK